MSEKGECVRRGMRGYVSRCVGVSKSGRGSGRRYARM